MSDKLIVRLSVCLCVWQVDSSCACLFAFLGSLSNWLSVWLLHCRSAWLSVRVLSGSLSVCLTATSWLIHLYVCLSDWLTNSQAVCLPVCPRFVCPYVCFADWLNACLIPPSATYMSEHPSFGLNTLSDCSWECLEDRSGRRAVPHDQLSFTALHATPWVLWSNFRQSITQTNRLIKGTGEEKNCIQTSYFSRMFN